MSTRIITETRCDRCGIVNIREEDQEECLPFEWSKLQITQVNELNNSGITRWELCVDCTTSVRAFINRDW